MILEVKQWPESQEVMGEEGWFFISGSLHDTGEHDLIGNAAYARILEEKEYILVEPTTADEYNKEYQRIEKKTKDFISGNDPGDEHMGKYLDIDRTSEKRDTKRRIKNRRKSSRRKTAGDRRK